MSVLLALLLQIVVVLAATRLLGVVFHGLRQPRVVGEMAAGILLGPSVLGWLAPRLAPELSDPAAMRYASLLGQVGVALFVFLIGLAVNPHRLGEWRFAAALTSHVSVAVPFSMAAALALVLYPQVSDASVPFASFALFLGTAMSVTAFPVLARILAERGLMQTRIGVICIACAAVDDVTGWFLLAGILPAVRAVDGAAPLWAMLAGSALFVGLMLSAGRRRVARLASQYAVRNRLTVPMTMAILAFLAVSALATQALGIHLLFGAFLAGHVMPKSPELVRAIQQRLEPLTVRVLLPLFFASVGLRARIDLVRGAEMWLLCAAIVLVAVVGKLGGSMIAARAAGVPWRDATAIGILMNTRGMMEVVVLSIGLDAGVISPALFSMMLLMALLTTVMTAPLLDLLTLLRWRDSPRHCELDAGLAMREPLTALGGSHRLRGTS